MELTEREKWLMHRAWSVGFSQGVDDSGADRTFLMSDWLEGESKSDAGTTVEVFLARTAPEE